MNKRYQEKLAGTVWENYQLIVTQWPTKTHEVGVEPPDNIDGEPFPESFQSPPNGISVSNTTLETYAQGASCMACHSVARGKNLDFVFFLDFHAFDDTNLAGAKPNSVDSLKKLLKALQNRKEVSTMNDQ